MGQLYEARQRVTKNRALKQRSYSAIGREACPLALLFWIGFHADHENHLSLEIYLATPVPLSVKLPRSPYPSKFENSQFVFAELS